MPEVTYRQYKSLLRFAKQADDLFKELDRDRVTPLTPELGHIARDTLAIGWRLLSGSGAKPRTKVPSADPIKRSDLFVALFDVWDHLQRYFHIPNK